MTPPGSGRDRLSALPLHRRVTDHLRTSNVQCVATQRAIVDVEISGLYPSTCRILDLGRVDPSARPGSGLAVNRPRAAFPAEQPRPTRLAGRANPLGMAPGAGPVAAVSGAAPAPA